MLITRAQVYPLEIPMTRPIKMSGETVTHAQTVLLRVTDEAGREGWGEAGSAPLMTGETLGSLYASTCYLVERLLGANVEAPAAIAPLMEKILYGNSSAKAVVETALMDLLAQRAGVPLYQLLNPEAKAPVRLEMLHMLASGNLEGELEEARTLRAQGYRHWKIKVGAGTVDYDVKRILGIVPQLKGDVVSADANTALAYAAGDAIADAGVSAGLSFLEQPFHTGSVAAMARLYARTHLPLCADESLQSIDDITLHADAHAAQGVSLKLIKLGGLKPAVEAGRLALSRGMKLNLACKVAESTISAVATAHVGFALGDIAWGFSMSNRYLQADVCEHPFLPEGGAVSTAQVQRPGLGYAPEAARLRDFASRDWKMKEYGA
ncbi:MAG: mandelate racemase/muconate lactonizing protein [Betaproteobacteria bacterium]|nr:mandelate racemase/muconate lactonizing protein [Betaproteobacteria bacterium]